MSRPRFNADGVPAKISEVQALPDHDRKFEAHLMRTHFQSWIESNFTLEEEQVRYLYSMDPTFTDQLARDIADCIEFVLPLFVRIPPLHEIGSKFVQPISTLIRAYDPIKGYTVSGELFIEIGYK